MGQPSACSFADNTLLAWGSQIRDGEVVRGPYATFSDDLVGRRGRRLELTGPESLTHEEMVAIIGEAIGRPLR